MGFVEALKVQKYDHIAICKAFPKSIVSLSRIATNGLTMLLRNAALTLSFVPCPVAQAPLFCSSFPELHTHFITGHLTSESRHQPAYQIIPLVPLCHMGFGPGVHLTILQCLGLCLQLRFDPK